VIDVKGTKGSGTGMEKGQIDWGMGKVDERMGKMIERRMG